MALFSETPLCRRIFPLLACFMISLTPIPLIAQSVIQGTNWFPIGPAYVSNGQSWPSGRVNTSGRATTIAVNPAYPDEVWLGTANGGVWHSTNGGVNFLPISDDQASLAIGSIAVDNCTATGCGTVYVGTGENSIRRDTYYGMGLLIGQISGGEFPAFGWTLVGATDFKFASINNVILDPTTSGGSKVIYLSVWSGVTASATESSVTAPPPKGYGIYKSTNQGGSWSLLTIPGTAGAKPSDLVMDPSDSQTLYAGFMAKGVFKTTNGGSTWCPLKPGIALPAGCTAASGLPNPSSTTFDDVRLAIRRPSAATPATLYAVLGNCPDPIGNGPVFGGYCNSPLYESTDGGSTWTLANPAVPTGFSRYHQALTIDPSSSSTLYFGGLLLGKSIDSGNSFSDVGDDQLHPDHHALVFPDPNNLSRMYNLSDGGFASSPDGHTTSGQSANDIASIVEQEPRLDRSSTVIFPPAAPPDEVSKSTFITAT